jgi:hypothetical protein
MYEMGAIAALSTPGRLSKAMHRLPRFSGKLSGVMPTPADLPTSKPLADAQPPAGKAPGQNASAQKTSAEIGGREGPEPTRFGDWELRGRCIDF